tara:strand:+ start:140 stop:631 length:492 start_codon:yes stop_codon:yes gene_type:complete
MIEILRLSHRIHRDIRLSTHVALTSRAFGADKIYYSGQHDSSLEKTVNNITNNFGGPFKIEHIESPLKLIKEKKKTHQILHLTVYGYDYKKQIKKIKNKNLLIIVGGEKVLPEYYKLSDLNIAVTKQPHSEAAALAIILEKLNIKKEFKNFKKEIKPKRFIYT